LGDAFGINHYPSGGTIMDTSKPSLIIVKTELSGKFGSGFFVLISIALLCYLVVFAHQSVAENALPLAFFALLTVACIFQFLDSFATTVLDQDTVTSRSPIRKTLHVHLSEVSHLRHRDWRQKLELLDADGNTRARINESVPGFAQFFDFLRARRPDLWPTPNDTYFRKQWLVLFLLLSPIVLFAGLVGFLAFKHALTLKTDAMALLGILLSFVILRKQIIGLEITPDSLYLQFPFRRERLSFSEIHQVVLNLSGENNATYYTIAIETETKRGYALNRFEINEVLIFDKLAVLLPGKTVRATHAA
jgi:hypothetical protein